MSYKEYLGLLLPNKVKSSQIMEIVNNEKDKPNGLASLNESGQVSSSQLPSYVDDIVEYNNQSVFPSMGETGKIYCDVSTGKIYRWSGSNYVEIPPAYSNATTAAAGLMSTEDKLKLDNCSTSGGGASYQYIADGTSQSVLLGRIDKNIASGQYSVAEGNATTASGENSHAEGRETVASTYVAHAEGAQTTAAGPYSHAEGYSVYAPGLYAHAEGNATTAGIIADNIYSSFGTSAHAEGEGTYAEGNCSHAEGNYTYAGGDNSHAQGGATTAINANAHAEGYVTLAIHSEAHAEGNATTADEEHSHAEGRETWARQMGAHAEGFATTAYQQYTHSQGYQTLALGEYSHAEGNATTALGQTSHAEGYQTYAYGNYSHVSGYGTIATERQTVIGQYNASTQDRFGRPVTRDAVFIIGGGFDENNRLDAFAVKQDGTLVFANGTEITPDQFTQLKALLN